MRLRFLLLGTASIVALCCSGSGCSDPGQVKLGVSGPGTDPATPTTCSKTPDLTHDNRLGIERLGLSVSRAILEGILSDTVNDGTQIFARFHVDKVWYGPAFLQGFDMLVPVYEQELASLELPGRYVLGYSGNAFPLMHETLKVPVCWDPVALFPASDRDALGPLVGYHSSPTPFIAVVRVSTQDEERTHFEVVETIQGNPPASFADNWVKSIFPVPFPAPSNELYIASMSDISYNDFAGEYLGSVVDFRAATPENRALVKAELGAPLVYWDPKGTKLVAEEYRQGWAYQLAPHVIATAVSSIADECCTNAGGTYIAQELKTFLRGTSNRSHLVTGGHAYYGPEACGDTFLLGVHGLEKAGTFDLSKFACDGTGVLDIASLPPNTPDPRVFSLPDTMENRNRVGAWLAADPAVYRLFAEDAKPTAHATSQDAKKAPWSVPLSVEQALIAGTNPSLVRVESATPSGEDGVFEIILSTTFSPYWYDHLTVHRVKIAAHCPDPRLLQVGTEWLGFVVFDGPGYVYDGSPVDYTRAFLIPGVLLPNQEHIGRVAAMVVVQ